MNRIAVALRVLTGLQEHSNPVQADIENLRSGVDPAQRDADPGELACMVINAEIELKKNSRTMRESHTGLTEMDLEDIARTRINFLNADLDLANTFVELARTEMNIGNRVHAEALLQKATVAHDAVKRLMLRPPPIAPDDVAQLAKRGDELESSIRGVR